MTANDNPNNPNTTTNPATTTKRSHHRQTPREALGLAISRNEVSRQGFSNSFIRAMRADFETYGVSAIKRVRSRYPAVYLKICALILPKEVAVRDDVIGRLSDDQLAEYLNAVSKLIESKRAGGEIIDVTPSEKPRKGLRPLLADDEDMVPDQGGDDDSSDNGRSMIDGDS